MANTATTTEQQKWPGLPVSVSVFVAYLQKTRACSHRSLSLPPALLLLPNDKHFTLCVCDKSSSQANHQLFMLLCEMCDRWLVSSVALFYCGPIHFYDEFPFNGHCICITPKFMWCKQFSEFLASALLFAVFPFISNILAATSAKTAPRLNF